MADYAIKLLTDTKLAEQISEACLVRARNEFSSDRITEEYEQIYYRVLGRKVPKLKPVCS
ncbi:hypothetical protein D3C85_1935670 [compost metagenome]